MDFITQKVNQLYEKYPYPSLSFFNPSLDISIHANKIAKPLNKTIYDLSPRNSVLDVGCGTGEITCSLAFGGAKTVGVDLSKNSLKRARLLAKKLKLSTIKFLHKNLFDLNLNQEFDFVFSLGVLHHTSNPKKGFEKLVQHTKSNGFITIGLYNVFGRFKHRLRRKLISVLAGKDIEKRIALSKKLFHKGFASEQDEIYLADKFAHPNERYSSLEEVFSWFKEFNIKFVDCNPKISSNPFLTQINWLLNEKTFFIVSGQKLE